MINLRLEEEIIIIKQIVFILCKYLQSTQINEGQIIIDIKQMQHQKRILSTSNNNQNNQQHHGIMGRQPERIALIQRKQLYCHSVDVKTKSEGSLQLSRSSVSSRERKVNKKIQLKQSLQFVLQQDDHTHHPEQVTINKPPHPKQIQTSMNFIAQALQNHQFPQARTEIDNFINQTKKYSCTYDPQIKLLSSVSNVSSFIQNTLNAMKSHQQQFVEINKSLQFANKFFRQGKWFQFQKIKIKLLQNKSSKLQLTLGLFLESIIGNDSKTKSKQSKSTLIKSKEKHQKQKVTDLEMDSLRKQLSKLTVQLQKEKGKSNNTQGQKQVRNGSLQKGKKYQSERVSMLQKKCLMLQLQIDSKSQQVQSGIMRIRELQSQLCESLTKIERLQKLKSDSQQGQQIQLLQTDLNILTRQNEQTDLTRQNEQGNDLLLKKLEEKDKKILELQQQLRIIQGKINTNQVDFVGGLQFQEKQFRMQLSQKDMEIIRLKRQIIQLLQQQNIQLLQQQNQTNAQNEQLQFEHQQQINDRTETNQPNQTNKLLQLKDTKFNSLQDIVSKWVSYESTIKKLQTQNEQSARQIQSLRRQLSLSKHQYQELQRQLKESMNHMAQRDSDSQEQQENGEQMRMMNALSANYNNLKVEMRAISNKIDVLLAEKQTLLKQIQQLNSTIQQQRHTIQQQNQHYEKQLSMKNKQQQSLSIQIINLKQQISQLQQQNTQLSLKNKQLQISLRANNQNNKLAILNLEQHHTQLISKQYRENNQLRVRIQQLSGQNNRLIKLETIERERVQQLMTQINQMRQREILNNNQSLINTQSIDSIHEKHNKLLSAIQKDKAQLKQQIINLQKHNQILTSKSQTLTNNFKQMVNNYESKLTQQIKNKQQELHLKQQEMNLKLQKMNLKLQEMQHKQQEILLKNQQLSFKNQQIKSLYEQVNFSKEQLTSKISQIEQLTIKLKQQEHEKTQLNHSLQLLQKDLNSLIGNPLTENINNPPTENINNTRTENINTSCTEIINSQQRQLQLSSIKQINSQLQLHNDQLHSELQSLTIQLSKVSAQKGLLKQQLYNNQQDSMKGMVELKQQNRKLREFNNSLTNQNGDLSNQLVTYKQSMKQMTQQMAFLQEQLVVIRLQREKQQIRLKGQISNLTNTVNQIKQKVTAKDEQMLRLKLQNDMNANQFNTSLMAIKDKQMELSEVKQKSRQAQMSLREKLQSLYLGHTIQKNNLVSQLKQVKQERDKNKMELQVVGRELVFLKTYLQKKEDQNLYLNQQTSSLKQTISSMKSTHQNMLSSLKHQIQQLQSRLLLNVNTTNQNQHFSSTNSYQTNLQQIQKLLQITTNKLNQSLTHQTNLSHQINNLNKCISQLEAQLEKKIQQISQMGRDLINSEIKAKQIQRKAKYELLHIKAHLDTLIKSKQQIQQNCNRLSQKCQRLQQQCRRQEQKNNRLLLNEEIKLLQKSSLQSQISNLVKQQSAQITALQQQLSSIKAQNQKTLVINLQLKKELFSYKKRNQELMLTEMELERVNRDLIYAKNEIEMQVRQNQQLSQNNYQLKHQLDQSKQQILQLHQELSKAQQQYKIQLQSYRNSQRVLDNQLIQYKSRLQNVSDSLRQQNQKSSELKQEIQKLRTQKNLIQKELHLKTQQSAQQQNYLRRQLTRLQRELQQTRNTMSQHHKTLLQTHAHQLTHRDEQITYLNQQLLNLTQQNSHFHLNHSLLYSNPQYPQHLQQYSIDYMQQHPTHQNISFFIDQRNQLQHQQQEKQQLEYDLLLQVQSKIHLLVQENNMLKQKLYHQEKLLIS